MNVTRERKNKTIYLDQSGYIDTFIKKFNINGTTKTPATLDLMVENGTQSKTDVDQFLSGVMTLMYIALRTRPDILMSVAYLSTKVKEPNETDKMNLIRIFKYLNGSKDLRLQLCPDSLNIYCWIDASFAIHNDKKSHSGYIIGLGKNGSLTFVRSSKQKLVTKSSTESELVALNDGISHVMWTRFYLESQGYFQPPTVVFQDNMSTMVMANKGEGNPNNSRHINIRYFYIKELIDSGEITVKYCPTSEMKADLLTKPLIGNNFFKLRQMILKN